MKTIVIFIYRHALTEIVLQPQCEVGFCYLLPTKAKFHVWIHKAFLSFVLLQKSKSKTNQLTFSLTRAVISYIIT